MASGDFLQSLTVDPGLCNRAAECGLRFFQIMAGALDGMAVDMDAGAHVVQFDTMATPKKISFQEKLERIQDRPVQLTDEIQTARLKT